MPSQRTLRDYSHCVDSGTGFSNEVDQNLLAAAKLESSADYHRLVVLLMDEMFVKESLVYNKDTGKMIGFTDLGDVNNSLIKLEHALSSDDKQEPPLARTLMVFMVRVICFDIENGIGSFYKNLKDEQADICMAHHILLFREQD